MPARLPVALLTLLISTMALAAQPGRVLLLGTFHFQDPGLDVAKVEGINVFSDENQAYLEALTTRLAGFKPTQVLLEYGPENDALINERYQAYLAGEFELRANEIYQLGFRIARKAGLERVQSFDHRELEWAAEPMFEYAKQHDSAEMVAFNQSIAEYVADEEAARKSLPLGQLLMRSNDPERDAWNMDTYLATNTIGVNDGWSGADSTASWWHRNFRMYALIQQAAKPGERVIAIGGSGHTAILKQLLKIDQRLEAEDVRAYLPGEQ